MIIVIIIIIIIIQGFTKPRSNTVSNLIIGTYDKYEVGDLSGKYGSFLNRSTYDKRHIDYNLPLFGPNSIQGRSVLFHNHKIREQNRRWVCSNLKPVLDPKTHFVMKAAANFTGPTLKGMIVMVS